MDDIYQILRLRKTCDRIELQNAFDRLADTFSIVRDFSEDKEVAQLAAEKYDRLIAAGKEEGLSVHSGNVKRFESPEEELGKLRLALNSSRANAATIRETEMFARAMKLPESAEKHYLLALALLHADSSFAGCGKAVPELSAAVQQDPDNEAYRGLLEAIQEQMKLYQDHQKAEADKAEEERKRREREAQEALRKAQRDESTGQFMSSMGYCLSEYGPVICGCICLVTCCKEAC